MIGKIDSTTRAFAGQGDLFIWDPLSDSAYETATIASFSNPVSLGQIVQDSTTWEGEDVSTDPILDEQGNTIVARTTAGTLGFSFDIASLSPNMVKKFLAGKELPGITNSGVFEDTDAAEKVVGFGVDLPVFTCPIAIVNQEKNLTQVYPKAQIASNFALSDGMFRIHAVVTAQYVSTDNLMTGMLIPGKLK